VLLSSELLFKEYLAPATCRWCDRAPDGTDRLNRLDRWGRALHGLSERANQPFVPVNCGALSPR
jgi:hypothetical protein